MTYRLDKWNCAETWYDVKDGFISKLNAHWVAGSSEDARGGAFNLAKLLYLLGIEPKG